MSCAKMTFFPKASIIEKLLKIETRKFNTLDKNVIAMLGVNFKLLSIIAAEK